MRVARSAAALLLAVVTFAGFSTAVDADTVPAGERISVTQTVTESAAPGCAFPAFGLTRSITSTTAEFRLTVRVATTLCSPVNATAAIYSMPTDGSVWPQTLAGTSKFTLREPGTTVITFSKSCLPEQFDVIVGATPQTISPLGAWHGPLLFPFDTATALQHPGWGCASPTTSTTVPATTSTVVESTTTTSTTVPVTSTTVEQPTTTVAELSTTTTSTVAPSTTEPEVETATTLPGAATTTSAVQLPPSGSLEAGETVAGEAQLAFTGSSPAIAIAGVALIVAGLVFTGAGLIGRRRTND